MGGRETEDTAGEHAPRRFIRHAVGVPLRVRAQEDGAAAAGAEARNVSAGGLSFVWDEELPVGSIVEVHVPAVEPPFTARARVAWTAPEDGRFCIGVQFLDAADAFRARMVEQVCEIERYRREVQAAEGRTLTTREAAAEWIARYAGRFPG